MVDTSNSKENLSDPSKENQSNQGAADQLKTPNTETSEKTEETNSENITEPSEDTTLSSVEDKFNPDDLETKSIEELVSEMSKLLNNTDIIAIKKPFEQLRAVFDSKFSKILSDKKETFINEGGESIDFYFESKEKSTFNQLNATFRKRVDQFYTNQNKQKEENLIKRQDLIEALKNLIENGDAKTMYQEFKKIDEKWKNAGPIPQTKYNNTWRNYHHHVERFYDLLHLNNDLRDLDFKHNLEEKLKLIDRAQKLNEEKDINIAFKELQTLHKLWKDVGPVDRNNREKVWKQFSDLTKLIHDRRNNWLEDQKSHFDENAQKKEAIINQLKNIDTSQFTNHNDWQKGIQYFESIRQTYFEIGKTSRSQNQKLWNQLKEVSRSFNRKKNSFYKSLNSEQSKNLDKKRALIDIAVNLKDSEDFETATETFKKIQSDWKKIGHVPRKYSDKLWKEFKEACNHFFDRLKQVKEEGTTEEKEALVKKQNYIAEISADNFERPSDKDAVVVIVQHWKSLGKVASKDKKVNQTFFDLIQTFLKDLDLDVAASKMFIYEIEMTALLENDTNRFNDQYTNLRKEIDDIQREVQQLENNKGFLSNMSEDNPLLINVNKSLNKLNNKLQVQKKKMQLLRRLIK